MKTQAETMTRDVNAQSMRRVTVLNQIEGLARLIQDAASHGLCHWSVNSPLSEVAVQWLIDRGFTIKTWVPEVHQYLSECDHSNPEYDQHVIMW